MAQPHPPHHPHRKSARPLDPADLPDPLADSRDVPMASADDLLSEMVGDDVERMMSGEFEPIVTGHRAVERLQHQIGKFLDEVRQREQVAQPTPFAPPAAAAAAARPAPVPAPAQPPPARRIVPPARPEPAPPPAWDDDDDAMPPLDDLVGPTTEHAVGLHSGEFEASAARGPAESRALLAPVNPAAGEPVYLKPLDWLSRPVAAMSGKGRVAMSLLALMSFLGGCAALGYVLMLRHGGV